MSYTTSAFWLFFSLTFCIYYLLPGARSQVGLLIVASLVFYAWESPALLGVFLGSWLLTALSSYAVLRTSDARRRRLFALSGVMANMGLLALFKYKFIALHFWPGLADQAPGSIAQWIVLAPLPIGISFYTFHGISLLVDVWRGNPEVGSDRPRPLAVHLGNSLLYLVFFPQLIAGPIIKAKDFFPQVVRKRLREIDVTICFRTLVTGFFLKSVVADNLSEQTYWIDYPYFQLRPPIDLVVLLYGYSAQIFADFAGYSLIAIGLAGLLGYRLPQNFNFPYISASIAEFWRRWHISLSSWLRDYLYIPLGGNRKGAIRTYVNLILVMLLGGLWHGAALSFAIWGLWHGIGLALERLWVEFFPVRLQSRALTVLRIFLVFNFVALGWLFFKLQNFSQAWSYLSTIFTTDASGFSKGTLLFISIYALPVAIYHLASLERFRFLRRLENVAYGVMLVLILTSQGPAAPFIYFQF